MAPRRHQTRPRSISNINLLPK